MDKEDVKLYTHTMESHLAIKKNKNFSFATTRMDPKGIIV